MTLRDFIERVDVSRETSDRLQHYHMLLTKWNKSINLVSNATLADVWTRHFLDSAQLFGIAPATSARWVDLGSGGGFPGLVIAILAAEHRPDMMVELVESDLRKAAFLMSVIRETNINAKVASERAESLPPLCADVLSARALAPLPVLLTYAERHLLPGGTAIFPKGTGYRDEVDRALETWRFSIEEVPSLTDPNAAILKIEGLSRV